jgi:hypothetical protein
LKGGNILSNAYKIGHVIYKDDKNKINAYLDYEPLYQLKRMGDENILSLQFNDSGEMVDFKSKVETPFNKMSSFETTKYMLDCENVSIKNLGVLVKDFRILESFQKCPEILFLEDETYKNGDVFIKFKIKGLEKSIFDFYYDPNGKRTRITGIHTVSETENIEEDYIYSEFEIDAIPFYEEILHYIIYQSPKRILFINSISKQVI